MNTQKELLGASTRLLILSVLAKESSYGYQIIRRINESAEGLFTWREGTVYPLLHKLELEGLVRAQWQESDKGRDRKYYYITAKGRAALKKNTREWNSLNEIVGRIAEVAHA